MVINKYKNKERKIKIKILQSFLSSFFNIFFIYINGVLEKIRKICLLIIFLLFIDKLEFISLDSSIKKVRKAYKKVAKIIIEWEIRNTITYNISKIKTVLFLKTYR